MTTRRAAEVFPPGEFLREELDARGWTQTDLAAILDRPLAMVNEIIAGKRRITPETAKGLAAAFGTSPELWLNLESAYQLWQVRNDDYGNVARRARMYSLAPVKEMQRRGWLGQSKNLDVLERQLQDFFGIDDLGDEPRFLAHAARKSSSYERLTPAQRAWLFRAEHLARAVKVGPFSERKLKECVIELRSLMQTPESVRDVPRVLGEAGVPFVVVEALQGTRIDGACFWQDGIPVVAMSLRFDRIDNFWFVLMHELGHVSNRDGALDIDIDRVQPGDERPECERLADEFAAELIIPTRQLDEFIQRVHPRYSANAIERFSHIARVHPGIVVGQLQHRGLVAWNTHRKSLVPVRDWICDSALTDGWGIVAQLPQTVTT